MNPEDEIILDLIEYLKFRKVIKFESDFTSKIGMLQSTLTKIKNGTAHFTVSQIGAIGREFDVNMNFIYRLSPVVFNYEDSIVIEKYMPTKATETVELKGK